MNKFPNDVVKEVTRLQKYLLELHLSRKVCVFSELSGHVDCLNVSIRHSIERYNTTLFEQEIRLPSEKFASLSSPKRNWTKYIDDVIENIEFAIMQRDRKLQEQDEAAKARERKYYEELKAKYEQ